MTKGLDALWFALARDFTYTGPHDRESAHAIVAEHRAAIESAVFEVWRKSESDGLRLHAESPEHHYSPEQCRAALRVEVPA